MDGRLRPSGDGGENPRFRESMVFESVGSMWEEDRGKRGESERRRHCRDGKGRRVLENSRMVKEMLHSDVVGFRGFVTVMTEVTKCFCLEKEKTGQLLYY